MKILTLLFCLTIIASGPLLATELGVPPSPNKQAKIMLKDGRWALVVNEKLLIEENGKLVPAPQGSYTAANGTIWTVDAGGHAHSAPLKPGPNPAPVQSLQPEQAVSQDASSPAPQLNADGLKNVPAALKGLKIFMPGNALALKFPKLMQMIQRKQADIRAAAQAHSGSSNKVVLTPGSPVDKLNELHGLNIVGANAFNGPYEWDMADSTCPQTACWGEDNGTNCISFTFTCPAEEYALIDLELNFNGDPAGTWQITVTGPDGTCQTFQNLGPGTGHYHFAYFAQQNLNVGGITFEVPFFTISATQTATSPDLTKLWIFHSITISTVTP